MEVGDRSIGLTASLGVSTRLGQNDSMEQLVERADQALIVAKKLGRNRVIRASAMDDTGDVFEQVRQHGALFQGVTAADVMTTPISSLHVGSTVGEAAEFLRMLGTTTASVVDNDGKLAGVISEKDIICVLPKHNAWLMPIEQIMQRTFVSFEETAALDAICEFLSRVAVRRVFVVRDGAPIGVVSQGRLLRWYGMQVVKQQIDPATTADPTERDRLLEGAEVVARCATQLSERASGSSKDPLAPVLEGVRKLQNLVDALVASSDGRNVPISLTDSDSVRLSAWPSMPSSPSAPSN